MDFSLPGSEIAVGRPRFLRLFFLRSVSLSWSLFKSPVPHITKYAAKSSGFAIIIKYETHHLRKPEQDHRTAAPPPQPPGTLPAGEHEIHDPFPETRNHDGALDRVLRAASGLQLPVTEMKDLWRASEDFGHYLKVCPGAMFYIGNGEDHPAVHTDRYDFNDKILSTAVDLFLELTEPE